jgi:cytochrome c553
LLDYTNDQRYVDVATGTPTKSRNGHMMSTIAKRLTEEDKKALASYIQGLR